MLGYIKKEKENDENKRKKKRETVGKKKFRHIRKKFNRR